MAEQDEPKLRLLAVPEFKSSIPAHLLDKLTDQERYLVETLSRLEQQNNWLIVTLVGTNNATVQVEKRLSGLETWKMRVASRWAPVIALAAVLLPVFAKILLEKLWP
jgi:hypothetical protein